ncbi:MAG TPA: STAS domain-containing protein [Sporichthyaceae bacterium]|nr:STAS domain-containing protein [Sporichthyaceae bacterium]
MPSDVPTDAFAVSVDGTAVTVLGEVDLATAPRLRSALAEAAADGSSLHVDLRAVRYLDSAGMAALFEYATRGMQVTVERDSIVARVLEIGGLAGAAAIHLVD